MRLRSLVVATQPVVEPVSLAAAKAHLGLVVEQEEDHGQILAMIAAARRLIERRLSVALSPQQLRCQFDGADGQGWSRGPDGYGPVTLRLPVTPILTGQTYPVAVEIDGVAVSGSAYTVDADGGALRFTTPPPLSEASTLTVTYWAGQEQIAPQLRSALLLYVGHLYGTREAVVTDGSQPAEVPLAFEALLASESVTGRW